MIYFYEHKSMNDFCQQEIDLMGFEGVCKFANERGISPLLVFDQIKKLEDDIKLMGHQPFDVSSGRNKQLFDDAVDGYIDFFNKYATHDKQAYIILGNIACGKNTYAKKIEQSTHSMIVDPDRFKMGEETENGVFVGLTPLFHKPTDRERMQDPCSDASKKVLKNSAELGMNIILPKASYSLEKLEKQLQVLVDANYDIHLIQIETPIETCANRNYYRYLIKEYQKIYDNGKQQNQSGLEVHGRFVPISIITNIGDNSFKTFASAVKKNKYASYSAFFNDDNKQNEEIDLETMKFE